MYFVVYLFLASRYHISFNFNALWGRGWFAGIFYTVYEEQILGIKGKLQPTPRSVKPMYKVVHTNNYIDSLKKGF